MKIFSRGRDTRLRASIRLGPGPGSKTFGNRPALRFPVTLFGTQRRNHHARLMRFEGVDGGLVKGLVIQPTPLDAVDAPVFAAGAAPRSFVATPPTLGCLRIRSTRPCVRMSKDFLGHCGSCMGGLESHRLTGTEKSSKRLFAAESKGPAGGLCAPSPALGVAFEGGPLLGMKMLMADRRC